MAAGEGTTVYSCYRLFIVPGNTNKLRVKSSRCQSRSRSASSQYSSLDACAGFGEESLPKYAKVLEILGHDLWTLN